MEQMRASVDGETSCVRSRATTHPTARDHADGRDADRYVVCRHARPPGQSTGARARARRHRHRLPTVEAKADAVDEAAEDEHRPSAEAIGERAHDRVAEELAEAVDHRVVRRERRAAGRLAFHDDL